jgi:hypothetical protein
MVSSKDRQPLKICTAVQALGIQARHGADHHRLIACGVDDDELFTRS